MTGAKIIPFAATAEEAWEAFQALNQEALADPVLLVDRAHIERRIAAHERFAVLFRRECRNDGSEARRA